MSIHIRPAQKSDQPAIRAIVRAARINPLDLHWQRFLVAEEWGTIIGVGQVKPHRDGSRELASLAVIPEKQGQGVGSALVRALLEREAGPVFLMCATRLEGYYARLDFRRLEPEDMPPGLGRWYRLAQASEVVPGIGTSWQIVVMKWDRSDLPQQLK